MTFLENRKKNKAATELLRHARHFLHMREDIMSGQQVEELKGLRSQLLEAMQKQDHQTQDKAHEALYKWLVANAPPRSSSSLRENLEILAVAVAVAMACRTYFIQPFKIPTGSMQPTLYGIEYVSQEKPGVMDHLPLKLVKWLGTGTWYKEIKARTSGKITSEEPFNRQRDTWKFKIGQKRYQVPIQGATRPRHGDYVTKGTVLWRGLRVAGDHVFVDKLRWNFRPPKRGQITVFDTDDIATLPPQTHYIKRMVALPGESVSIDPPRLLINGKRVNTHETMRKIMNETHPYKGYKLVPIGHGANQQDWQMRTTNDVLRLAMDQYFTLGDNTSNSKDGRYWGTVPQKNLVGPAVLIYWPFSERWGLTR